MKDDLATAADAILKRVVEGSPAVPGAVAIATDAKGNIYEGAAGKRMLGEDAGMTTDTVMAIFSCTKAIAGTAIMQCVEEGLLDLDAPAKTYAPDIAAAQVLEGFDAAGEPVLRAPRREITTRMLMLHTAGFGYDFFNQRLADYTAKTGLKSPISATRAALRAPLLFDPGEAWEYGINIDWCGQVLEGVRGKRLGEVARERIFEPLGMTDTGFVMTPAMRGRLARIHQREADGSLTPMPAFELPQPPEVDMGGHGIYGTIADYAKFIRMYLNDGMGPGGRVLRPETVRMAASDGLAGKKIHMLPGVNAKLSNDAEFFPGMPKSWGLSFMINDEPAPAGRPAGALGWAGLANLYFWIDRENGVGGMWGTQLFPFADPTSFNGFIDFETAVYRSLPGRKAA
jgi:methyl acetate hydrolase